MAIIQCKFCELDTTDYGDACHVCGEPIKKKSAILFYLIATMVLTAIIVSCDAYFSNEIKVSRNIQKEEALKNSSIEYEETSDSLSSILEFNIKVINNSIYRIMNMKIGCSHYNKDGSRISTNYRTIHDMVPSKNSITFMNFDMGFIYSPSHSTECKIEDLAISSI